MLRSARIRSWLIGLGLSALVLGGVALGQGRGWWNRVPPRFAQPNTPSNDLFTFCRILYESVRGEPSGYGWNTDYPYSDINFMTRFSQLTSGRIRRDGDGSPEHVVVTLLDDTIFEYPFAFMSDVGTVGFSPSELAFTKLGIGDDVVIRRADKRVFVAWILAANEIGASSGKASGEEPGRKDDESDAGELLGNHPGDGLHEIRASMIVQPEDASHRTSQNP